MPNNEKLRIKSIDGDGGLEKIRGLDLATEEEEVKEAAVVRNDPRLTSRAIILLVTLPFSRS